MAEPPPARRPELLFSHDYPMDAARAGWQRGRYPGQHLWGTEELGGLVTVVDLPHPAPRGAIHSRIGDVGHEARILARWVRRPRGVVALTGEATTLHGLMLARRIGIGPPVVTAVHAVPGRVGLAALRGADRIVALSSHVADQLVARGLDPARIRSAPWGPDLQFAGYADPPPDDGGPDAFVLSSGKTQRDLPTLLGALERLDVPARVYAPDASADAWAERLPRVAFSPPAASGADHSVTTYDHVLDDIRHAAVFAIALRAPERPIGITELDDALALGRPVVMTRSPYIDCDLEAVGCGYWVEEGNVDGWVEALGRLMASPQLRAEMGARGRRFAETTWNAERFAAAIREAVLAVALPGKDT